MLDLPTAAPKIAEMPDPSLGEAVCQAIRREVGKQGLDLGPDPIWAEVQFTTSTDPFSGDISRIATWKGGARYGTVTFFPDGRIFAEYQVLLPHPQHADQLVETVQVWGRPGALKGDAVLVPWSQS